MLCSSGSPPGGLLLPRRTAGYSCAPVAWIPGAAPPPAGGSPAAYHAPERSRRGAGAGFSPSYADLWTGTLFHLSILMSSTEAGGAVCARRLGPHKLSPHISKNASAEIGATVGTVEIARLGIFRSLPQRKFARKGPTGDSRLEWLPIDYDTPLETPDRPPNLSRRHINLHLIAGLERSIRPAQCRLLHQVLSLDHPMHSVAALIFRIDLHENVGIRPDVLGHRAFYRDRLFSVVGRVAVMREQGQGSRQEAHNQERNSTDLISHRIPPVLGASVLAFAWDG